MQWVCPLPLQLSAETRNQHQASASTKGSFCSWAPEMMQSKQKPEAVLLLTKR